MCTIVYNDTERKSEYLYMTILMGSVFAYIKNRQMSADYLDMPYYGKAVITADYYDMDMFINRPISIKENNNLLELEERMYILDDVKGSMCSAK